MGERCWTSDGGHNERGIINRFLVDVMICSCRNMEITSVDFPQQLLVRVAARDAGCRQRKRQAVGEDVVQSSAL
eukprot:scaffold14654_cov50-Cyclotella_meneghiniana.AAC.10